MTIPTAINVEVVNVPAVSQPLPTILCARSVVLGKYLGDEEPPSADLQGEISPGFWVVRRDALDVDLDDLPAGAN